MPAPTAAQFAQQKVAPHLNLPLIGLLGTDFVASGNGGPTVDEELPGLSFEALANSVYHLILSLHSSATGGAAGGSTVEFEIPAGAEIRWQYIEGFVEGEYIYLANAGTSEDRGGQGRQAYGTLVTAGTGGTVQGVVETPFGPPAGAYSISVFADSYVIAQRIAAAP